MNEELMADYQRIRAGELGFYEQARGLIAVWGKEAVQFLNGMITNDVANLADGAQMLAAFPNAQGRLIALVRVRRAGERFLFETEAATREKVFQNLFRFTFAGDFFVEDLSEKYRFYRLSVFGFRFSENHLADLIEFESRFGTDVFVPAEASEEFKNELARQSARTISDDLYEILRIEKGIPVYGAEWDETTIVPELGLEDLISYNKGCYIGQEIIARIYFRGHVAKQLRGLVLSESPAEKSVPPAATSGLTSDTGSAELKTADGKNAGRLTSVAFSPELDKTIALGFVRYDYLAEDTELKTGETTATVKNLPFLE